MVRALWTGASGMITQQTNVDNISNNLANVNSTGFKKEAAQFKSLLYQNLQSESTNNQGEQKPVNAQVGLGVRTASITSIYTQGSLLDSTNFTDMAIEGDGFFQVRDENGQTLYTRNGNFSLSLVDGGSMLCSNDGYPVLDTNGNEIVFSNAYSIATLQVNEDGSLLIKDMDDNLINLNTTIGLVQFNNPAGLLKVSGGNLQETAASGVPLSESANPGLKKSKVEQYYLEGSNVQVVDEMVNLIVAQRAYEMNSKTIQAADTMLQQANNLRQ